MQGHWIESAIVQNVAHHVLIFWFWRIVGKSRIVGLFVTFPNEKAEMAVEAHMGWTPLGSTLETKIGDARCTQHFMWMGENVLDLKFKSFVHPVHCSLHLYELLPFTFPRCTVWASSSSPPSAVWFGWRFVCLALGDSSSALSTCSFVLVFHRRGKLCVSVNDCCVLVFRFLHSYGLSWSLSVTWAV